MSDKADGNNAGTVSTLHSSCLEALKNLHDAIGIDNRDEIDDEIGRYRVWAKNVGASGMEQQSLDQRLNEVPQTKKTLIKVLGELLQSANNGKHTWALSLEIFV
jgi:hypothetical protein